MNAWSKRWVKPGVALLLGMVALALMAKFKPVKHTYTIQTQAGKMVVTEWDIRARYVEPYHGGLYYWFNGRKRLEVTMEGGKRTTFKADVESSLYAVHPQGISCC